jgi:HlyD family secretion protein
MLQTPKSETSPEKSTNDPSTLREKVRSLQLPQSNKQVAQRPTWPLWLAGIALLLMLLGYLSMQASSNSKTSLTTTPSTKPVDEVPTSLQKEIAQPEAPTPAVSREGIVLESKGYFIPARKILVSPKVSGMLMNFKLEEGQRVNQGDILGVIESVEYKADVDRYSAMLDGAEQKLRELENGSRVEEVQQAQAEIAESQAMMPKLEADVNRSQQLIKTNGISQSQFDEISANYQSQKSRIDKLTAVLKLLQSGPREERIAQARAEVNQAAADIVKAKWRLQNCEIRSPISGTILKKNAEEGNIVNPGAMNGSFSLCEMADLANLEVDLNIQERDVSKIFVGQKCSVRTEAYPKRFYEATVARLMPIADRSKGAIPVRVRVIVPADEEGVYLKPEMGAIVTFYASADKS